MKRLLVTVVAVLNLVLADAVAKELAHGLLGPDSPSGLHVREVIPGFFNLAYVENRGMAWGLLQGYVWPLAAFACLAMGVLIWKRRAIFPAGVAGTLAELLLYAGILGNLIDRLARGCVIDMFDFHWGVHHFPCFNVADSYITVAAGLLILLGLFEKQGEKKRDRGRHDSA